MIAPHAGPYGRLHVGPDYGMTTAARVADPAPPAAPGTEIWTPVTGIWALLRPDSPWRVVFPFGWVPVTQLIAARFAPHCPLPGWLVEPARLTSIQQHDLARLLEQRGAGAAAQLLESFARNKKLGLFADAVARVHDFDTGMTAVVEIKALPLPPGGPGQ